MGPRRLRRIRPRQPEGQQPDPDGVTLQTPGMGSGAG